LISVSIILKFAAQEDFCSFEKKRTGCSFSDAKGGGVVTFRRKKFAADPPSHHPPPPINFVHAYFQRWSCMAAGLVPNLWKNNINLTLNIEYVQNRWEGGEGA